MRTTTPAVTRPLALAAALVLLAVAPTRADVAATGRFTISVEPDLDVNGSLDFDPGSTEVLGRPVDLKALVGRMRLEGVATNFDPSARSASFDVTLEPSSPGGAMLELAGSGTVFCVNPNCAGGAATLIAVLSAVDDPDDVLPDGAALTFDATGALDVVSLIPLTIQGSGVFGINAFPAIPTPVGSAVVVSSGPVFFDSRRAGTSSFLVDVRFNQVLDDGATLLVGVSAALGELPADLELDIDGFDSVFVDVRTTAHVVGMVLACFGYADANGDGIVDGTTVTAEQLHLLHRDSASGAFVDVTTSLDTTLHRVCGEVTSLSAFVVAVGSPPPTTTTTTPTITTPTITTPTITMPTTTTPRTTTPTTTTTTTLPACTDAATFASVLCRLDRLIADVEAGAIGQPTKSNLLNSLDRARARVVDAQARVDDGRSHGAKSKLKSAIRKLINFKHRLGSLSGRRRASAGLRAQLASDAQAIREDLKTLAAGL